MKRKILTLMVIVGGFALTSCQEDATMDELIQDTELTSSVEATNGTGSGTDGDGGGGTVPPPANN